MAVFQVVEACDLALKLDERSLKALLRFVLLRLCVPTLIGV
jgi:hypothetical protein